MKKEFQKSKFYKLKEKIYGWLNIITTNKEGKHHEKDEKC